MSECLPISLQIAGVQWQYFSRRRADKRFVPFAEKVWARDNHQCRYCGFSSREHMEVVNLNGNYRQNTLSNMTTSCAFCTPCFFLDGIGQGLPGTGVFIYMPDMTQGELNALCHVLMHGLVVGSGEQLSQLRSHYRSLRLRSQLVEKHIGEGFSDIAQYVRVLADAKSEKLADFQEAFQENVRFLPDLAAFSPIIQDCAVSALSSELNTQGGVS